MIYTSYWSRAKTLEKNGIEPVAISRGKPKWFSGRSCDAIAPTWAMLKMSDEDYWAHYWKILERADPHDFVRWLGDKDVALLCWEKDINDCHRKAVGEWLVAYGYECEEWEPERARKPKTVQAMTQMAFIL